MEANMSNAEISSSQLDVPYEQRWEILKPILYRLYIDERKEVKEIVDVMKAEYRFYASQTQYKRQFGIWNIKKALSSKKKEKIAKVLQTRSQQSKRTAVTYNGRDQSTAMRRHLKEQKKQNVTLLPKLSLSIEDLSGHALQCGNHLFMNWNMSPAVLAFLRSKAVDALSPGLQYGTPMSGVEMHTPASNSATPPALQSGPFSQKDSALRNEQAGMMLVARESLLVSRAHMFLTGDHMALLGGMNVQEQTITTDWLHQFWQFSFRTARTWGRGPRTWNAESLGFERLSVANSQGQPNTAAFNSGVPDAYTEGQSHGNRSRTNVSIKRPSSECRWSIHSRPIAYENVASPPPELNVPFDVEIEATWKPWVERGSIQDFAEKLKGNIESNTFSNIEVKELPLAVNQITRALKRTPEQLLVEALGFSIMARNIELVFSMFEKFHYGSDIRLDNLFPIHLAASYLDGSKTCCLVFDELISSLPTGGNSVRKLYTNHLNHTVLDTLMISILKAHTSCVPQMVDDAFKKEDRFAGEEVDICGRWDADSDCIQQLQSTGSPKIPLIWKHMFCHTSAQTMVHCLSALFGPHWAPDINTPSGIFLKRCQNEACGLKMQLKPLHTLVVTAVHLAQYGREGETLFGIIACLLCLLSRGANPLLKAEISVRALITEDYGQECSHSELNPLELAQRVPEDLISQWPQERRTGWDILCRVLELSHNEWRPQIKPEVLAHSPTNRFQPLYSDFMGVDGGDNLDKENRMWETQGNSDINTESENEQSDSEQSSNDEDDYECEYGNGLPAYCPRQGDDERWHKNYFRRNQYLATLWAAAQTELLTYRRLKEGDPWISEEFNMESVLQSMRTGAPLSIGLISKNLMNPFCRCGIFDGLLDIACVLREDACSQFFSNLEDWEKTTFLDSLEHRWESW